MKSVAFLCYGINDNELEQKRVILSLQSMVAQNYNNYEIIFLDCSVNNKRFKTPSSSCLRVEYYKPTIWHPSFFRNHISLMTNSDVLIHVNTDNIYSPDMAQFAAKKIEQNPKLLLHCRRRDTNQEQFSKIKTLQDAYKFAQTIRPRRGCAGDFQVISRDMFMELNGYWGLIENNAINTENITIKNAYQEDAWLSVCADRKLCGLVSERYTSLNKDATMNPNEIYWILHLWHPKRIGKVAWDKKH